MSTSIVHVLKVIGGRARSLTAECERLRRGRRVTIPSGIGSEDWDEPHQAAIDALCRSTLADALGLPFVYCARYVDPWSVAGSALHWFATRDHRGDLWSDRWRVWYRALPDRGWLARRIARGRRQRAYRIQAEDRWMLDHVDAAACYVPVFDRPALLLVVVQPVAASRHDQDYQRCLLDITGTP